jgi:hypothetical protein
MLTCLAYNWLKSDEKDKEIGNAILSYFKTLGIKDRYKLIWKTTTPAYGNLFKKMHTTLTQ